MADCRENTQENNDAIAARILASLDSFNGADNTPAMSHKGLDTQLHYGAWKSELDLEKPVYGPSEIDQKLQSPYKSHFNTGNEKVDKALDYATHLVMGNHPDLNVRPSEILGDDIVRPLEDSHREYHKQLKEAKDNGEFNESLAQIENGDIKDPKVVEKIKGIKDNSGYSDALAEAKEKIEDKFGDGQDDDRFHYGSQWHDDLQGHGDPAWSQKWKQDAVSNLTENHLRNNLLSAGRNYFDRWRAAYQFGIDNYKKGEKLYKLAVTAKSPELTEAGIHEDRFYGNDKGFDLFQAAEPGNKGITYFAAKEHALSKGYSEKDARLYGRKAVEQLQFQNSPVNKPKAQWNGQGRTDLALWTFGMRERRWYLNLWKGATSNNPEIAGQSRKALLYYMVGNGLLFGPNADIPEEVGQVWKAFAPESYRKWRAGVGTFSAARLLNVSLDETSRIPLTGAGMLMKLPVVYDQLDKAKNDIQRAFDHPSPKSIIKAVSNTGMLLPAGFGIPGLKNVGNKMTFATVQYLYKTIMGDYERRTVKNKKYTTSNPEELGNAIRGGRESFDRQMKKEEMDAKPGRHLRAAR